MGKRPHPAVLESSEFAENSATKEQTEGANREFYLKQILEAAYRAQGNVLLAEPTFRKLPLDLALGKHCKQQAMEEVFPLMPTDLR